MVDFNGERLPLKWRNLFLLDIKEVIKGSREFYMLRKDEGRVIRVSNHDRIKLLLNLRKINLVLRDIKIKLWFKNQTPVRESDTKRCKKSFLSRKLQEICWFSLSSSWQLHEKCFKICVNWWRWSRFFEWIGILDELFPETAKCNYFEIYSRRMSKNIWSCDNINNQVKCLQKTNVMIITF